MVYLVVTGIGLLYFFKGIIITKTIKIEEFFLSDGTLHNIKPVRVSEIIISKIQRRFPLWIRMNERVILCLLQLEWIRTHRRKIQVECNKNFWYPNNKKNRLSYGHTIILLHKMTHLGATFAIANATYRTVV